MNISKLLFLFLLVGLIGTPAFSVEVESLVIATDDGTRENSFAMQALPSVTDGRNCIRKKFYIDSLEPNDIEVSAANILIYGRMTDFLSYLWLYGPESWQAIKFELNGHKWDEIPYKTSFYRRVCNWGEWGNENWAKISVPDVNWLDEGENELVIWNCNPTDPTPGEFPKLQNKYLEIGIDTNTLDANSSAAWYNEEWSQNYLCGATKNPEKAWKPLLITNNPVSGEYMIRLELISAPNAPDAVDILHVLNTEPIRNVLETEPEFLVVQADVGEKIRNGCAFDGWLAKNPEIDIAGEEYESVQLGLWAVKDDLSDVGIKISGLTSESRMVAEVFRVGNCEIPVELNKQTFELWPDPLYPIPEMKVSVNKGQVQPLFVRFHALTGGKPGEYNITVSFSTNGKAKSIPITVRRHAFDLDRPGHFALLNSIPAVGYSQSVYDHIYYDSRLADWAFYGGTSNIGQVPIVVYPDGKIAIDVDEYERRIREYLVSGYYKKFTVGFSAGEGGGYKEKNFLRQGKDAQTGKSKTVDLFPHKNKLSEQNLKELIRCYKTCIADKGLADRVFMWGWDEAYEPEVIREASEWGEYLKPLSSLKTVTFATKPAYLPVTEAGKRLFNAYDIFVFTGGSMSDDLIEYFKKGGKMLGIYTGTELGLPSPTINRDSAGLRAWSYFAHSKNIDFLAIYMLDCFVYYKNQNTTRAPGAYKRSGSGQLLFGGMKNGEGSAEVPLYYGIRFEAVRDSLEDYEYIYRVSQFSSQEATDLLNRVAHLFPTNAEVPHDLHDLLKLKADMAQFLDEQYE